MMTSGTGRQTEGTSDQVPATHNTTVRLEVGTAHRCDLDETNRANNERTVIDLHGVSHPLPVGGAHL